MDINLDGHTLETMQAQYLFDVEYLQERIAALELALEDTDWIRMGFESDREFSRTGLKKIAEYSRIMYLKNPLIQRGINVQRDYVFGQGVVIQAEDPDVDEVVQAFLNDDKNKTELTSHQARTGKEVELSIEGNIFFVFFPSKATGRVLIRTIQADEIEEIICNPEDSKDPWYYKRVWSVKRLDMASGSFEQESRTAYYPDWRYQPRNKPGQIGSHPIEWDSPVYHMKVGGLPSMKFGVPESYAALDWAKAYKSFLEDWATIVRAYARFAWNVVTKSRKGVQAAKKKLASTLSTSSEEKNPSPSVGSFFVGTEGESVAPIRTAGATTSAEDGRRLLLMVAATMGLPETFFGDVSVGTLATARTMDRPTELKIVSRQTMWEDAFTAILDYVVLWAVRAGSVKGTIVDEEDGTPTVELEVDPETGEPRSAAVRVEFPPVLEHDTNQTVSSIVDAATLKGSTSAGTIDMKTVSRLLLTTLGVDDVEALLDMMYPEGEELGELPEDEEVPPVIESLHELVSKLQELREAYGEYSSS